MSNTAHASPIPENKAGSKEMAETMDAFESSYFKIPLARESRESNKYGAFYQDGKVNEMFNGFLKGIAYARNLANLA